ncbi:MAG: toprim domain-containing protein [Candidatus Bathyarchaeia archaeon]|nr:toprim domain-containing protein [Candidatus Bathyarchaeota archaeon]
MRSHDDKLGKNEEIFDGLSKAIQDLRELSNEGTPIIVEGKNDVDSLKKIGVNGRILKIKGSNMSLQDFIYSLSSEEEAIILTDFDREGDEIASELMEELTKIGVKANNVIRRRIRRLVGREVAEVEALPNYLMKLALGEDETQKFI